MKDKYIRLKSIALALSIVASGSLTGCTEIPEKDKNTNSLIESGSVFDYVEKTFEPGEHVILVPIDIDNNSQNVQIDVPDGYEVVGISDVTQYEYYVLFKNTVEVTCRPTPNGYTSFGTPTNTYKR